jgi:hypothetical protein
MSTTESLMVLALGFVLALICVLLFARMVWNIGQRLSTRRADKNRPALIRDLEADRDQRRAGNAMMQQKLDSKLAESKARMVEQQAEVSRHRNRVQTLIADLNLRGDEITRQSEVISTLNTESESKSGEIDNQAEIIASLKSELEAREDDVRMLKSELSKTIVLLDESKDQLVRLEGERNAAVVRQRTAADQPYVASPGNIPEFIPQQIQRPAKRFDFGTPDDHIMEPPKTQPGNLADLLSSARRNMQESQANMKLKDKSRSNPIANVVSIAQRLRSQDKE